MALAREFDDLKVYSTAFETAMEIFRRSKAWPADERYALTQQIRNSSRSVCASIAEAWRKRRYPAHFVSKLSDADSEAAETQHWLKTAHACGYLDEPTYRRLRSSYDEVARGLVGMMNHSESWCGPSVLREEQAPYGAAELSDENQERPDGLRAVIAVGRLELDQGERLDGDSVMQRLIAGERLGYEATSD